MPTLSRWTVALALGGTLVLSGCMATRTTSSLQETPGAATLLAGMKFNVIQVESTGSYTPLREIATGLQQQLMQQDPALFTNDLGAIPLLVRLKAETDNPQAGAMVTGFTLGLVPMPHYNGVNMEVGITPWAVQGAAAPESVVSYALRRHQWGSILPIGLIPLPGRSDFGRGSFLFNPPAGYEEKSKAFSASLLHKAIVTAIAKTDQQVLRRLWTQQQALPSVSVDIDGRPFTGRLVPAFSQNLRQPGGADEYRLILRSTTGEGDAQRTTMATIPVARRDAAGNWTTQRRYLPFASRPTLATALLQNGVPARVVVMPVDNPPVGDFIDPPVGSDQVAAGPVRWSNGMLLHIKNSSLAAELRALPITELQLLTTRLESAMLDLNERTGRANDRAQAAMEKGENPEPLREMATVYRQRGEIMKAIVGQVRQETALRNSEGILP
ncbi:MAG: hypothetical protein ACLGHE_09565 [Gammaproteobacteria bacterium]